MNGNALLDYLYEMFGGKCQYCGVLVEREEYTTQGTSDRRVQANVDHIVPKSSGGGNGPSNVVLACQSCNSTKGPKSLEEFRLLMACRFHDIPRFTTDQKRWLAKQGFGISIPHFEFYGEAQGTFPKKKERTHDRG